MGFGGSMNKKKEHILRPNHVLLVQRHGSVLNKQRAAKVFASALLLSLHVCTRNRDSEWPFIPRGH